MLNILYTQISNLLDIEDISETNGVVEVRYYEDNMPSELQLAEINDILALWPLMKTKLQKIQDLNDNWKTVIK